MKIHEYQGKAVLRQYAVPVPRGDVATTPQAARQVAESLDGSRWVVKAQIHAGGRGKGGGIRIADSLSEVEALTSEILGHHLVTPQTGPQGQEVRRVLIEEGCDIAQELYCGLLVDRASGQLVLMLSPVGGMDIEEVAATTPENIFRESIDVLVGLAPFQARRLALQLGFQQREQQRAFVELVQQLYHVFCEKDCSLLEINPLIVTGSGKFLALDVKMQFDDNALFRHQDISDLRDTDEEDPLEVEASKYRLNYIKLSGNVGCIVNGAGLAMATLDLINEAGATAANFLDVSGAATAEMVENAFRILMADPEVKVVLINIFGGILRCDVFAEGLLKAVETLQADLPIVAHMRGTNVEEGKRLLSESGLNFLLANDLAEIKEKIVEALGVQI
ncbi:ADP-forming succinate--CoA ligase subunit beta [Candidatus Entotheonella serta]|nr:ADP-forming succinate--CoA ligase subunit beta [Candidatus Entotheonella serta]